MSGPTKNLRELLIAIGMGHFNVTMVIPYMMISPATTDPKSSQIILLVEHIQRALFDLGATDVVLSGRLDAPTAAALERVVGPNWERRPWSASVAAIVEARDGGQRILPPPIADTGAPIGIGGPLDFLPDVPGGLFTYAVAGFLLYRHFSRKHP